MQGVANRDLKLDNLLLVRDPQSGNPLLRICDFGYSKVSLGKAVGCDSDSYMCLCTSLVHTGIPGLWRGMCHMP